MIIYKYQYFINEGRGISNIIKKYTTIIYESLKCNDDNDIILDFDDESLQLKNVFINYVLSDRNFGLFDPRYAIFKDGYLYNIIINLEINKNDFNSTKLKEIITHELTHCMEYYKIKLNEIKFNFDIVVSNESKYISVRKSINSINFDNDWNILKSLIYLSLDTEYNSRISQLYQFLIDLKSKDREFLLSKLLNSETYKSYNYLNEFNPENFLIRLKLLIGENATIGEINRLNDELIRNNVNKLKGYEFIKIVDINNIKNYLENWNKLFKQKNKKHLEKIDKIIDEVISDVKDPMKERTEIKLDKYFEDLL
jgi:hypothetical protein